MKNIIILLALTTQIFAATPQTSKDVRNKLESIVVKKLDPINDLTIQELMPLLYKLSVDSKGQGINFIFNQNINSIYYHIHYMNLNLILYFLFP